MPYGSVHALDEACARQTPSAPAVVCGGERLSYGQLDRRANQLARRLRDARPLPGRAVPEPVASGPVASGPASATPATDTHPPNPEGSRSPGTRAGRGGAECRETMDRKRFAGLRSGRVMSVSVKPWLADRQPSSTAGCSR